MTKIIEYPGVGAVELRKTHRNRNIRVTVRSGGRILITMPRYVPYSTAIRFMESKIDWVVEARERAIEKANSQENSKVVDRSDEKQIEELRKQAKLHLPARLDHLANKYGFKYNRLFLKNNRSNWGSCSSKGNINLNISLILLSQELSDYVILHELCHLKYPNHGEEFHKLLNSLCDGKEREYAKALRGYRL